MLFGVAGATSRNFLVQLIVQRELCRVADRYLRGELVDIGCGSKPYADLLRPYVATHTGVDHAATLHGVSKVDLIGSACAIPVESASFDSALCSAVLEHVEDPESALRECLRVLKSGSFAVYTVPFIWHLHEEPRDFYRFTKHGLHFLFEKAGFEIVELKALSGFWVTFGQLLVYNLHRLNLGPVKRTHIVDAIGLLAQAVFYLLDRLDRTEQWTWMYLVVARKR